MRKAFTLVEMLVFLLVTTALLWVLSPLVHRLLSEAGGSQRLLETHAQLQGIVAQIQSDLDRAVDLPPTCGAQPGTEAYLCIRQPEGVVVWWNHRGQIARLGPYDSLPPLADPNLIVAAEVTCSIPQARLSWQRRWQDDRCIGLETETAAIQNRG